MVNIAQSNIQHSIEIIAIAILGGNYAMLIASNYIEIYHYHRWDS